MMGEIIDVFPEKKNASERTPRDSRKNKNHLDEASLSMANILVDSFLWIQG